jgi:RNA polymerase sigma-70 factor (ECF subfamily)
MDSPSRSQPIDWQHAISTHRHWLRKVLQSRIGDRHAIDDLMQELALAVVRQSSNEDAANVPKEPAKVAPFLYRVAVRQAANFHRKANRKTEAKPEPEIETLARDPGPLDWLLQREQNQNLNNAIESLDDDSREILMLKYTENWTYRQLADHLGTTEKVVEHRLAQARKQLRRTLEGNSHA